MPLDEDTLQTLKRIREDLELDQDIEEEVSFFSKNFGLSSVICMEGGRNLQGRRNGSISGQGLV
jgi:hypothetical protein